MYAKDLIFFMSKHVDLRYCVGGYYQSLRYLTRTRTGKGRRAGRLEAFANKKYTSIRG
jgi:hypothetical protein